MNEIDSAIYSRITAGTVVMSMLADTEPVSVYSWQAPNDALYPFVVFNDMSDTELNDTSHEVHDIIYQIRGFTKQSMKAAKNIDYQLRRLFDGYSLSVTGYTLLDPIDRIGSVRFVENQVSTEKVYSAGGLYRIRLQKNT